MLVSAVQPVAILSAVFWTFCILFMCVGDMMGDQDEFAYSRIGHVIVWNVVVRSSFLFSPLCGCKLFDYFDDVIGFVVSITNVCAEGELRVRGKS